MAPTAGSGRNQSKATRATRATMRAAPWLKDDSQVCSSPMPSLGRGHGTWIGKAWQKVEILGIENSKLRGGGSGTSEDPSLHKLVGSMVRAR